MSSTDNITRFRDILIASIHKTAITLAKPVADTHYCFLLKDSFRSKCICGKIEIDLLDGTDFNFIEKSIAAVKVNLFIKDALLKFSQQDGILKQHVNVMLKIEGGDLALTLRNGNAAVRPVSIEELV